MLDVRRSLPREDRLVPLVPTADDLMPMDEVTKTREAKVIPGYKMSMPNVLNNSSINDI